MMTRAFVGAASLALITASATAQDPPAPIQDNSFLIEEAYNQERGVVQHIATFERAHEGGAWAFSFTQEWPVPAQRHQLGFTLPLERPHAELGTGLGDIALNYRYQLVTGGPLALSPRVSLLLPTGDEDESRGAGATGVQLNLPVSVELGRRFVTHFNAGLTHVPSARNAAREEADLTGYNVGQSLIWLAAPTFNAMVELLWTREAAVVGSGRTAHENALFVAPGFRYAINLPSGVQIVPGVAVPIGIGDSDGEWSTFFYLSVEHAFRR